MKTMFLVLAGTFVIASLFNPSLGAGWFWDIGNGLGFAALAGLLYLSIASARNMHLAAHRFAGHATLLIAAVHVFWFLFGDNAASTYIKPGAPHYMWAGILGFVLLNTVTVLGLPEYRRRIHQKTEYGRHALY